MLRRTLLQTLAAAPLLAARPRMRSAICAYSFREALKAKTMNYDDLVRLAVELDVDGLDLTVYWFPDTSDGFLLPLRRLAYKSAVEIYSISIRSNMCRETPALREAEVAEVKTWIDAAARLGAGHIRVFGGTVPKTATEDQAAGWVVEVLKRAADYAGSRGVILGLENHGGITEKADRILEIVRKVDSPWVGINVDTGNFRERSYEQVEKCIPHAVNVQLKADVRGDDGKAQPSDWSRFVKMLAKSGYRGYVALEYEEKEDPAVAVPRLIRKL
ncbi:MAG: sugar phosphate isomerase/epimerase family protein, partial [Bryobacteraceae bacterium]